MIDQLHIYLASEDSGNHFAPAHFAPLQNRFPGINLVFLNTEAELLNHLPGIEWLDTWHFKENWFSLAPKLRGLFTPAAGKDWVAKDPRKVVPTYFGTFHGAMIAETMLGLMLHFSRNMPVLLQRQQDRVWDRNAQQHTRLLCNQTATIIGYGTIGKHCGRLLTQMGMTVFGAQRKHDSGIDPTTGVEFVSMQHLNRYLRTSDHTILLLPGEQETRHFMNSERFQAMKPGSHFYNFGRGSTVDEAALVQSLASGHLAGAGIDVTETEPLPRESTLWLAPGLVLLPHSSCVCEEYQALHVTELASLLDSLSRD